MKLILINPSKKCKDVLKKSDYNVKICRNKMSAILIYIFSLKPAVISDLGNNNIFIKILYKIFQVPVAKKEYLDILKYQNIYATVKKREIPIILYHRFVKKENEIGKLKTYTKVARFKIHLKIIKFLGYKTITFIDLEKIKLENRFDKKYIIITVDDGYECSYKILFPLLKKYNMKAVIFLVNGVSYNTWTLEKDGKKHNLLSINQKMEMIESGLIEFGGHTLTHPSLIKIPLETANYEIINNKKNIEKELNIKLTSFAYPYGNNNKKVRELVKQCGYKYSLSTDTGTGIISDDLYLIKRNTIDNGKLIKFLKKITRGYSMYKFHKSQKGKSI